ncbi:MAG: isochorismate synthase [Actinomycetota bacterium]|nr:isochorismate synthase [Actinomycetota bacterium]
MIPDRNLDLKAVLIPGVDGLRFAVIPLDIEPLSFVRSATDRFEGTFYFSSPEGSAAGGIGIAAKVSTSGPERFQRLRSAVDAWSLPEPFRAFAGFSFSSDGPTSESWESFGSADAVLPIATLLSTGGSQHLLLALPPEVDADTMTERLRSLDTPPEPVYPNLGDHTLESYPPVSEWTRIVAEAVAAIESEAIRKVVLARSVIVRSDTAPDGFNVLSHLERSYRQCFGFGWRVNGATFIGASPELLVRSSDGAITSNPLAGTAPRGEGEAEDRLLAEALMRSEKDRIEHRYVVDDVAERLESLAEDLVVPAEPSLKRMATVQHLSTRVTGTTRSDVHVLDLVDALHPTPAVGGTPRDPALAFIEDAEPFDRGWYTGGIGWIDGAGDGEFAIGLRCGLLEGTNAHVFAGAGIVADSDPDAELLETRLKFRPMLELLAAT